MAQFIDPTNQTLLWQTIQKHSFTSQVFPEGNEKSKITWFKNIISDVYNSYQNTYISNSELIVLNKYTLRKMIEDMRSRIQQIQTQQYINTEYSLDSDISFSRESILQDKTNDFQRDLEYKQKEYEELFKKPTPPPLEFEQTNDQVIQNMDELIARQLRERENDLQQISLSLPKSSNNDTNNKIYPRKPILNIESTVDENIKIDILEIQPKKHVSWDMKNELELKIENLTKKYNELLEFLEKTIPNFKNELSEKNIKNIESFELTDTLI